MGILIKPEHKVLASALHVRPKEGLAFSLEELQEFIEGYFELLTIRRNLPRSLWEGTGYQYLMVNEEGKLKNLPFNSLASALHGSEIVGNAVLLEGGELE